MHDVFKVIFVKLGASHSLQRYAQRSDDDVHYISKSCVCVSHLRHRCMHAPAGGYARQGGQLLQHITGRMAGQAHHLLICTGLNTNTTQQQVRA